VESTSIAVDACAGRMRSGLPASAANVNEPAAAMAGQSISGVLDGPPQYVDRITAYVNLALIGAFLFFFGTGLAFTREFGVISALAVVAAGALLKYFAWRRAMALIGEGAASTARED